MKAMTIRYYLWGNHMCNYVDIFPNVVTDTCKVTIKLKATAVSTGLFNITNRGFPLLRAGNAKSFSHLMSSCAHTRQFDIFCIQTLWCLMVRGSCWSNATETDRFQRKTTNWTTNSRLWVYIRLYVKTFNQILKRDTNWKLPLNL